MPRMSLMLILHIFIGSTLAGSAVVVALATGYDGAMQLLLAAVVGFLAAFPVSMFVANQIDNLR